MKILIIEDDMEVVEYVKNNFTNSANSVDTAYNGADGSYLARINPYDVIIIDYSLPEKNGLTVCSEIRNSGSSAAILFLSMNQSIENKVACLEAGADDYMTKPFFLEELNARVKALVRRPKKIESFIMTFADIVLDMKKQEVKRAGVAIYLTRTEYGILEFLLKNKGMIVSRGMIMEYVWSAESDPFSNTVEAHIVNLRRKIGKHDKQEIIRNVAGRGYIIG